MFIQDLLNFSFLGRNPLTSYPLDIVWEEKSTFFPPLAQNYVGTYTDRQDMKSLLMDCSLCRCRTLPVVSVLTCILQFNVFNCFKLFQIERINRELSFLPTGRVWWAKKCLLLKHWRHFGESPSPARGGGGCNF